MRPRVNPLLEGLDAPPIPEARGWVRDYRGEADPLVDLSQAAPGSAPPAALLARLAAEAGTAESARYGDIRGDAALREALSGDLAARGGGTVRPSEIAITAGCNQAFFVAMLAVARAGDAVLLPVPWYFNHQTTCELLGIEPRPLPCDPARGFVPDPAAAEALIDARVRAIALVTPNNPTGAIYSPAVIHAVAEQCRRHGAMLVLDETYRDFLPEGPAPHGLFDDPAWGEVLVHLYSFSKAYCVPGHRVGAIAAGAAFMAEFDKACDTYQICPARPAQSALAWAIPALVAWRAGNRALMASRAAVFRDAVSQLPGWRLDAIGTYFAYLRLPEAAPDALRAAEILAAERGLMTLPGPFFGPGQDRHLRLAFANAAEAVLAEVPGRLSAFS